MRAISRTAFRFASAEEIEEARLRDIMMIKSAGALRDHSRDNFPLWTRRRGTKSGDSNDESSSDHLSTEPYASGVARLSHHTLIRFSDAGRQFESSFSSVSSFS
jgi:hypothetical protein